MLCRLVNLVYLCPNQLLLFAANSTPAPMLGLHLKDTHLAPYHSLVIFTILVSSQTLLVTVYLHWRAHPLLLLAASCHHESDQQLFQSY